MKSALMSDKHEKAMAESRNRCKHEFSLVPEAVYPVLRLQSAEVAPRLEAMVDRTGGRRGIFQQLSDIAGRAGHCLVLCDADQVVVRLESRDKGHSRYERQGIALGSCWNERIAGTNGVSMAMALGETITVRGEDHFFSRLSPFSCTSVPLLDACNRQIGAVSLSAMDTGNAAEYIFTQQLLEQACRRIQRLLFEQHYKDALILSVSSPAGFGLCGKEALVALDGSGLVLGATRDAAFLPGIENMSDLAGSNVDSIAGLSIDDLAAASGQVYTVHLDSGDCLTISVLEHQGIVGSGQPRGGTRTDKQRSFGRRRLSVALRELSTGSRALADTTEQMQVCFANRIPILLEGESGTGKTRLVKSLHGDAGYPKARLLSIDCSLFDASGGNLLQASTLLNKVSALAETVGDDHLSSTLLLENISDLPPGGQTQLRSLLETLEDNDNDAGSLEGALTLNVVALTSHDLRSEVESGRFREDLYYLLCGAHFSLPALRDREGIEILATTIATRLAGTTVQLTTEAREAIRNHDWPGNIRELRNTLRQALIAGNGSRISLCDMTLFPTPRDKIDSASAAARTTLASPEPETPYCEKTAIMDALLSTHWNVSRAARKLGIGRATIHRKMLQYAIVRPARDS